MFDLKNNIKLETSLAPILKTADVNGTGIDLKGFSSAMVLVNAGAAGDTFSSTVKTNFQLEHSDDDATIGNNVTIGHGVICHAKNIMDNCLLGNGSILNEGVIVGEFSLISSGSMVLENMKIPPRSLVMGNPARIRGEINERHVELIKLSSSTYVDKVKVYLDSEQFS